ncbi:hypothetical protein HPP92_018522 [Vanilla planifolia]|uniref:Uncharacterized protein n=1 Tax=Vanilla planifolia TaxID=51239 RepID=A0A835UMZ3_VANPL|nr:hypothetical protein HPP92_018522 [Vanilla planifolia]
MVSNSKCITLQGIVWLTLTKLFHCIPQAKALTKGGNILEFADPKLNGDFTMEAFEIVLKLAISCTADKRQRPSMEQVVKRLEKALEVSARSNEAYSISFA